MPPRRAILFVAAVAALLAACGGGGSSGGKTPGAPPATATRATITTAPPGTPPPGTPDPTTGNPALDALMIAPCDLLTDTDIAAFSKPAGPGVVVGKPGENKAVTPVVVTRDGITTSRCRWDMPGKAYLEVELYLLSGYNGPPDYAKESLAHWADVGKAASQPVAGIGDFAGLVVPAEHSGQTVAIFFAQKGTVVLSVYFSGPADATWPTAPQLQALGAAASARVF